jgi:formylglycine-generating enzyme required for sulfatase activity
VGESCCASLDVIGGYYYRTYTSDEDGGAPTAEADPTIVSDFKLDVYLVTVGRFREFVNAVYPGGVTTSLAWTPVAGSGKHTHLYAGAGLENSASPGTFEPGWNPSDDTYIAPTSANLACDGASTGTWTNTATSADNLPISCVTWQEAYAFCIWDGGFLPSEAEWEYAAAGGSFELEYPWGSAAPGTINQYAIYGCYYGGSCTNVAPVGSAPLGAALWGQVDMAGEVWEWNLDWYASAYVQNGTAYFDGTKNSAYLTAGSLNRVLRGGSAGFGEAALLPPFRNEDTPTTRSAGYGFRCARTP